MTARWGTVSRAFHWATVLAVAVMVPTGILMTSEPLADRADALYIMHKGLGSALLVFVLARVTWRLGHPSPGLPEAVPGVQRRLMAWTHAALYGLLLTMVVSGYVRTVGDRFPIELLDVLGVPPLIPEHHEAARLALIIHQIAAYTLVALVSVHAAAAVRDALIDRKGIFLRMWPPWAERKASPPEG